MARQAQRKFVVYLRVSTDRQGRSGLGLDTQQEDVSRYVAQAGGTILAKYKEVESGKTNDRPELAKALKQCRLTGAVLLVAKLDRLSRNAAFLMTLQDSETEFVAADMPGANRLTVGIMALVAQQEREAISQRTKAALTAAKARGTKLGGRRQGAADIAQYQRQGVATARQAAMEKAEVLREIFDTFRRDGLSLSAMARTLNEKGILTSRGKSNAWTPMAAARVLKHLEASASVA